MVGFHGKPLCFCGSDLQICSQVLPVRDNMRRLHKEVPRLTGCIMVTARYSDQQRSKSRQKKCDSTSNATDQCPTGLSNLLNPYREQRRSIRIVVAYPRPEFPATKRIIYAPISLINKSKFLKATHRTKIRKIEIPRSMMVEALSW